MPRTAGKKSCRRSTELKSQDELGNSLYLGLRYKLQLTAYGRVGIHLFSTGLLYSTRCSTPIQTKPAPNGLRGLLFLLKVTETEQQQQQKMST